MNDRAVPSQRSRSFASVALAIVLSAAPLPARADAPVPQQIDFNRDVRKVLSDNCFACHGPDKNKRKADLRLDTEEGLLGKAGHTGVVVPRKPDESELSRRV